MSDLLAIFATADSDPELLSRIAAYGPDRVTVLLQDPAAGTDWALEESSASNAVRDRIAQLMAAIERHTGATVVGLAGSRAQLAGWRFDRELSARVPVTA